MKPTFINISVIPDQIQSECKNVEKILTQEGPQKGECQETPIFLPSKISITKLRNPNGRWQENNSKSNDKLKIAKENCKIPIRSKKILEDPKFSLTKQSQILSCLKSRPLRKLKRSTNMEGRDIDAQHVHVKGKEAERHEEGRGKMPRKSSIAGMKKVQIKRGQKSPPSKSYIRISPKVSMA